MFFLDRGKVIMFLQTIIRKISVINYLTIYFGKWLIQKLTSVSTSSKHRHIRSKLVVGVLLSSYFTVTAYAKISQVPTERDTLRIIVAYTSSARLNAGGTERIKALIRRSIFETNYSSSVAIKLVHAVELNYPESNEPGIDLGRLRRTQDNFMREISTLRKAYQADVVSLWIEKDNDVEAVCGLGYLINYQTNQSPFIFNIIKRQCATDNLLLGYELNGVGLPSFAS
jgi:hypothetical protein